MRFSQLALLLCRSTLLLEGLELLEGDLPVSQLHEDSLDLVVTWLRVRRSDENLFELQVVVRELLLHLHGARALDLGALLDELDERLGLPERNIGIAHQPSARR
ncbi:hypothetical protein [Parvivirga hydrogeniphila]|uniref:hypothetical protein n=1 Tax=Parvivirga hydrogeniphila TaxID=2939460 RepID=UPI002B2761BF|nr:hypothetical protein [Parvivirga hydrogeniphila]